MKITVPMMNSRFLDIGPIEKFTDNIDHGTFDGFINAVKDLRARLRNNVATAAANNNLYLFEQINGLGDFDVLVNGLMWRGSKISCVQNSEYARTVYDYQITYSGVSDEISGLDVTFDIINDLFLGDPNVESTTDPDKIAGFSGGQLTILSSDFPCWVPDGEKSPKNIMVCPDKRTNIMFYSVYEVVREYELMLYHMNNRRINRAVGFGMLACVDFERFLLDPRNRAFGIRLLCLNLALTSNVIFIGKKHSAYVDSFGYSREHHEIALNLYCRDSKMLTCFTHFIRTKVVDNLLESKVKKTSFVPIMNVNWLPFSDYRIFRSNNIPGWLISIGDLGNNISNKYTTNNHALRRFLQKSIEQYRKVILHACGYGNEGHLSDELMGSLSNALQSEESRLDDAIRKTTELGQKDPTTTAETADPERHDGAPAEGQLGDDAEEPTK